MGGIRESPLFLPLTIRGSTQAKMFLSSYCSNNSLFIRFTRTSKYFKIEIKYLLFRPFTQGLVKVQNMQAFTSKFLLNPKLQNYTWPDTVHMWRSSVGKVPNSVQCTLGWSVEFFFIGQNRSTNRRSGMILEVQIQNFGRQSFNFRKIPGGSNINIFL